MCRLELQSLHWLYFVALHPWYFSSSVRGLDHRLLLRLFLQTCRSSFIQMKCRSVVSQLSWEVHELEQSSCFSKSFHSERGFPGILTCRLSQGQEEPTRAVWTDHTIQDLAVHTIQRCLSHQRHACDFSVLGELMLCVCAVRNWKGLVQGTISTCHVLCGRHYITYGWYLKNPCGRKTIHFKHS